MNASPGLSAVLYSGCKNNVPVLKRFFSATPYAAIPSLGVSKPGGYLCKDRVLCIRARLRHWCSFVFSRVWRKKQTTRFTGGR